MKKIRLSDAKMHITLFSLFIVFGFSIPKTHAGSYALKVAGANAAWKSVKLGYQAQNLWSPKISPAEGKTSLKLVLKDFSGQTDWNNIALMPEDWSQKRVTIGNYVENPSSEWFSVNIPLSAFGDANTFRNISYISLPFVQGAQNLDIGVAYVAFEGSAEPMVWFDGTKNNAYDSTIGVTQIPAPLSEVGSSVNSVLTFPKDPTSCNSMNGSCKSSLLLCGESAWLSSSSGTIIDGSEYAIPPYQCSGNTCNTPYEIATLGNWDVLASGIVKNQSAYATIGSEIGDASQCAPWKQTWEQLNHNVLPSSIKVTTSLYSTQNSCEAPKVYYVDTSDPELSIGGNSFLCGLFIVSSHTKLVLKDHATLIGTVLSMGDPLKVGVRMEGDAHFFGKMVFNTTMQATDPNVSLLDTASIRFSPQAILYALQALNGF